MADKLKTKTPLKGLRLPERLEPIRVLVELVNSIASDKNADTFAEFEQKEAAIRAELPRDRIPVALFEAEKARLDFQQKIFAGAAKILHIKPSDFPIVLDCPTPRGLRGSVIPRQIPVHDGSMMFKIARSVRFVFREIAAHLEAGRHPDGTVARRGIEIPLDKIPASIRSPYVEVEPGDFLWVRTDVVHDLVLAALSNLESWRLRVCPACERLYLAKARNAIACSEKCGNAVYMRRWRRGASRRKGRKS